MTVRRASFLGLAGLVLTVWILAVGCNLDTSGYGETQGLCSTAAHCDDQNACTIDSCGDDGICVHTATDDGPVPDGVQGNCKVLQCSGGKQDELYEPDDVDDGNPCTEDKCGQAGGVITATHDNLPAGVACAYLGALGACDGNGACSAECGFVGEDGNEVECPAGPNPCTISFCDKAKGKCVTEKLDGIPAPGGAEPGECGGDYCVDGEVKGDPVAMGTPCVQTEGTDAGKPGVCSSDGKCIGCNTKFDCQDATPESECHQWVCMGGTCQNTTEPNGPLASQVIGDCHVKICTNGSFVDQIDPADVMDDGNDCTNDVCNAGVPDHTFKGAGSGCGVGGMLFCDGAGTCKGCISDSQCGGGTECKTPKCDTVAGDCYLQPEPAGKVINAQTAGDCTSNVCDANGNITTTYNPGDPQNDSLDCTVDTCVAMNQTSHTPQAYGTTCDDAGGIVCDAAAHCVGKTCAVPADCPGGTFCVDGVCCDSTCGGTCQACSAGKKGAGPSGLCGAVVTADPDSECPGNSSCNNGACVPLPNGAACVNVAGECTSGFCADGFCCNASCNGTCMTCSATPGTCSPVANGQDPANECTNGACNGAGACRKDNGQPCVDGAADCLSGICVDGVCCNTACGGTCQACNVSGSAGTCTSVPTGTDPANECTNGACNGGGQCKLDNGQACGGGGDCLSGQCVDGVCCNTSCTGTCKACNVSGSVGTCANIPGATDPANECTGVTNCNGSGACTTLPIGTACTLDGECGSGHCVDGVCCNTTCGATCQACNVSGSVGTCTSIPSGTDPANECTGNGGTDVCDGSGVCKRVNGTTCGSAGVCLSGFCVDGVCCNNTCSGTCQACDLSGNGGTCTSIANGQDPASECAGVTTCDGAGACTKLAIGAVCTLNGECGSGFCVDGVCCNTSCLAGCMACNLGGSVGTCSNIPTGTDPGNDCAGTQVCDGAGGCKKAQGDACGADAECLTGHCADGVCCDMACDGMCEACVASKTPSANGTCDTVDTNTDPDGECTGNQVCSMMGTCVGGPDGGGCAASAECGSGFCVDSVCCDTACSGTCKACSSFKKGGGSNGVCGNINAGSDPDAECIGANTCDGSGACATGQGVMGDPCNTGADCSSTFCVDSVCCDSDCTGACKACSTFKKGGGTNGLCDFIGAGNDPDGECDGATPNCDGAGMCGP